MWWLLTLFCCVSPGPNADSGATTTGTSSGTYSQATTCTGSAPHTSCVNPQSVLDPYGQPTGYEVCEDGALNRADEGPPASVLIPADACTETSPYLSCDRDADCQDGANGRCLRSVDAVYGYQGCDCFYPCQTDSDCGPERA